jgi:hypothetical protein
MRRRDTTRTHTSHGGELRADLSSALARETALRAIGATTEEAHALADAPARDTAELMQALELYRRSRPVRW